MVRAALRFSRAYRDNLPHALREAGLLAAIQGLPERVRDLLNRSMAVAGEQKAQHELAQSLLARGKVGELQGWSGASEDLRRARDLLSGLELRGGDRGRALTPGPVGEGSTFMVALPRVASPGLVVMRRASEISSPAVRR